MRRRIWFKIYQGDEYWASTTDHGKARDMVDALNELYESMDFHLVRMHGRYRARIGKRHA